MKTSPFGGETRTVPLRLLHAKHYHIPFNIHHVHLSLIFRLQRNCAYDPLYTSFNLDREQLDLVLVAVRERREVTVKDNVAAIEFATNFASRDATVADLEGYALLEVARDLPDLDRSEDGDIEFHFHVYAQVYDIIVDDDLENVRCVRYVFL